MFQHSPTETGKVYRLAIAGLLAMSVAALAVTFWVMQDFLREQEIVQKLIVQLPPEATASAEELAGELKWQFRLSILVVLNLIVTGLAVLLLSRAYRTSQESLRDIKATAGDILSSMDQAVITTDLSGNITSINRRGREFFSLKGNEIGVRLDELSPTLALEEFRLEAQSSGPDRSIRDFSLTTNQTSRTLRAFCQPLRDHRNAEIGNIVQFRDVTERVLMDERMRRMERYMGLGSLAAGLHHEIKNPLAALSLHVQLLDEGIDGQVTADEIHEMLSVIRSEVTRIGGVLEGFRDFASIGKLNISTVDPASLISRQVKLISLQAERQNIEVCVELPDQPLADIDADRVRLEQVLLNLFVNAMDAMPEGGTLIIRVSMRRKPEATSVHIEVVDTGPGIPENLRDRIFDPYFTTKSEGTGMGLALCEKIIRQHGGNLEFRTSDLGTTFEVTLPVEER